MNIDRAEVIVTSPHRNFVTLKLTTDDGLTGLGDATLNGRSSQWSLTSRSMLFRF